uniref:Uncharacterized protein n=1 Tax=Anguilla anguilla TaxID=7936 RepID=A0A0E9W3X4_ANGAN
MKHCTSETSSVKRKSNFPFAFFVIHILSIPESVTWSHAHTHTLSPL